ncbi:hypothetical protein BU26DRAFT_517639 [Trematosphaeria pertusa]|uniref:Uncharacterized protein n=1 Tax=Trematosphaeria pertusa TaxID=390896 RepID=A0A6A6IJU1_9PLEO|nr:uncharacterized protein BU26DRAFT_517639 [Trematosphaeria pertusa]KAF2250865.1 hypothetical protein BU26DRAFT_517639 [Trematosphaeria pertusa]
MALPRREISIRILALIFCMQAAISIHAAPDSTLVLFRVTRDADAGKTGIRHPRRQSPLQNYL